jgi:osmoprotectant transport system permease protein
MSTTLAILGDFGRGFEFIFHERESRAGGSSVGGADNLPLLREHLKLCGAAMGIAIAVGLPIGLVLGHTGIPPILTNAFVGVQQVDREAVDAARGMGLSGGQIVRSVELPLALPLIFGGIKTSTVNVIATATIAPLVGVVTLGDPIISQSVYGREGQIGASIIVGALAVIAEVGLSAVQRAVTPTGVKLERPALIRRRIQTTP